MKNMIVPRHITACRSIPEKMRNDEMICVLPIPWFKLFGSTLISPTLSKKCLFQMGKIPLENLFQCFWCILGENFGVMRRIPSGMQMSTIRSFKRTNNFAGIFE
mmetsp:Transcript_6357/g.9517  ORF Transcript_6357/g.9517 Transcript_6357/m.9517 type:complete len:104 (-) Transcript_6357:8-319(-)